MTPPADDAVDDGVVEADGASAEPQRARRARVAPPPRVRPVAAPEQASDAVPETPDAEAVGPDAIGAEPTVSEEPSVNGPAREAGDAGAITAPAVEPVRPSAGSEVGPEPTVSPAPQADTAPDRDEVDLSDDDPAAAVVAPPVPQPVLPSAPAAPTASRSGETVLAIRGLTKRYGSTAAVEGVDLDVRAGAFYGLVGPNGAGKTTTLSMVTGLLRPDGGTVHVHGIDVWAEPLRAKRAIGVLPDALRLFDRLSGAQLLHYSGVLRGLDAQAVRARTADLIAAFGLEDAAGRLVADYSAGMTKKIALACAMIHSPRLLVLDEPFESVDPVSAANIVEILQRYTAAGGTVVLSSHGMDLVQRVCDHVAIVVAGRVLAAGTMTEVRAGRTLEERFVELAGGRRAAAGMEWLHSFTD